MARYAAKRGRVYMSTTGSGTAAPVASLSGWTLDMDADYIDTTSFEDTNETSVKSFEKRSGTLSGFWDDADDTLYAAAESTDGVKLYLYPSLDAATKYWYGTAWVSSSLDVSVKDAVKTRATFQAKGSWGRM